MAEPRKGSRVGPTIDARRGVGAGDCVSVCPFDFDLFKVRKLSPLEQQGLLFGSLLKVLVHDGRQRFVVRPEACEACGLCVRACPDHAIRLSATGVRQ
jgi:4Fe-4S ferredoxin